MPVLELRLELALPLPLVVGVCRPVHIGLVLVRVGVMDGLVDRESNQLRKGVVSAPDHCRRREGEPLD